MCDYMPIAALNQFCTDFTIKARIVKKSLRYWKNAKGEGDILSLDLIDREGTMITATAFKEVALNLDSQL